MTAAYCSWYSTATIRLFNYSFSKPTETVSMKILKTQKEEKKHQASSQLLNTWKPHNTHSKSIGFIHMHTTLMFNSSGQFDV
jgi:hypothetical protein